MNQKLCYIQMLLNIEKSAEQDLVQIFRRIHAYLSFHIYLSDILHFSFLMHVTGKMSKWEIKYAGTYLYDYVGVC